MAAKKTAAKKTAAKKAPAASKTSMVSYKDRLAAEAEVAASAVGSTGGGSFFSTNNGILSWQDQPIRDNQMAVVILDFINENLKYATRFVKGENSPPLCFAFGRGDPDKIPMFPHKVVVEAGQAQSTDGCDNCEHNQWGSADVGTGKSCGNRRRLALLPIGTLDDDGTLVDLLPLKDVAHAEIGMLKLPVTSVKGFKKFVKKIGGTLDLPPHGIVTRVSIEPNEKQFSVVCDPLQELPEDYLETIFTRRDEAMKLIDQPYNMEREDDAPQPAKRGAAKRGARKY